MDKSAEKSFYITKEVFRGPFGLVERWKVQSLDEVSGRTGVEASVIGKNAFIAAVLTAKALRDGYTYEDALKDFEELDE